MNRQKKAFPVAILSHSPLLSANFHDDIQYTRYSLLWSIGILDFLEAPELVEILVKHVRDMKLQGQADVANVFCTLKRFNLRPEVFYGDYKELLLEFSESNLKLIGEGAMKPLTFMEVVCAVAASTLVMEANNGQRLNYGKAAYIDDSAFDAWWDYVETTTLSGVNHFSLPMLCNILTATTARGADKANKDFINTIVEGSIMPVFSNLHTWEHIKIMWTLNRCGLFHKGFYDKVALKTIEQLNDSER
jgi:hypothetical protein